MLAAFIVCQAVAIQQLESQAAEPQAVIDRVVFGDTASETAHALSAHRSDIIQGGLGMRARRLLKPAQLDGKVAISSSH